MKEHQVNTDLFKNFMEDSSTKVNLKKLKSVIGSSEDIKINMLENEEISGALKLYFKFLGCLALIDERKEDFIQYQETLEFDNKLLTANLEMLKVVISIKC